MSDAKRVIRLSSAGPLFRSGGFELSRSWSSFVVDELTAAQIETLRARYGRWIRVYPEDRAALEVLLAALDAQDTTKAAKAADPNTTPILSTTTKAAKAADPNTTPILSTTTKAAKAARKDG